MAVETKRDQMLTDENIVALFKKAVLEIEKKELPELSLDTDLSTLGFDSVTTMEILSELEDHLDVEFPEEELENIYQMSDLVTLVKQLT